MPTELNSGSKAITDTHKYILYTSLAHSGQGERPGLGSVPHYEDYIFVLHSGQSDLVAGQESILEPACAHRC